MVLEEREDVVESAQDRIWSLAQDRVSRAFDGTNKYVPVVHLPQLKIGARLLEAQTNLCARIYILNISHTDYLIKKVFYY